MRLLFVCTGNVCRSPLAERLALVWAEHSLGSSAVDVHVSSAGTAAPVGRPMDPHTAVALTRLGGEPAGHRARRLTPELADASDLVLTMTRQQRHAVLSASPRGLRRTFTLLEAADLLHRADLRGLELLSLRDRAAELATRLDAGRAQRQSSGADDVPDPIGQPAYVHDEVAQTIADALGPLASVLFLSPGVEGPLRSDDEAGVCA